MDRAGKARRRVIAGGYGEEEQHSRRRCSGDRMPAYLWSEALSASHNCYTINPPLTETKPTGKRIQGDLTFSEAFRSCT